MGDGLPLAPFRTDDFPLAGLTSQAPFAVDDSFSVEQDGFLLIPSEDLLSNDFDLNLDPLEVSLLTSTPNGNLILQPDGTFVYLPEEGFAGTDSFTYRAVESNGNLASAVRTVTIVVEGTPTAYYLWRQTIAWLPGDDQTTQGDPDGDGVLNLLEYALGQNPLEQDSAGLPRISLTPTGADYSFNNIRANVIYEVQLSTDLVDWTEPAFATLDNTDSTPVELPHSEGEEGRLFVRLRVLQSDN